MPKLKYKMLDRKLEVAENRSDVVLTEIGQIGDNKLRMIIRSNSYKAQNSATISRFDGTKWQQVARIVPEATKTREGLVYRVQRPIKDPRNPEGVSFAVDFLQDHKELVRQAELILA